MFVDKPLVEFRRESEVQKRLVGALADRLLYGSFPYSFAMAIIAINTRIGSDYPFVIYPWILLGLLTGFWRTWAARGALREPERCLSYWRPRLEQSTLGLNFVWTAYYSAGLWVCFGQNQDALLIIAGVAFSSAAATGMAAHPRLCAIVLVMQLVPLTIWSAFATRIWGLPIFLMGLYFCFFTISIARSSAKNMRQTFESQLLAEHRSEELQKTAKALQSAKDLAEGASLAQERFLANMSHEIRTPLNGVIGLTQVLAHSDLPADQREILASMQRSGEHLLAIVSDILDISKINAGKMEIEKSPLNLAGLIQDVAAAPQALGRAKGILFDLFVSPEIPALVDGDPVRIRQVLGNLIGNAVKFTKLGHIRVTVAPCRPSWVRFAVEDSGIGIAPEQLPRLFEDFSQADKSTTRRFGGTGLGLSICKRLVALLGGEIGVESVQEKGSTFWFELPLPAVSGYSQAGEKAPVPVIPAQVHLTEQTRILLAEDNPINRMVCERLLRPTGAQIETAENGRIALNKHRDRPYDIILMDCSMPEMDGFQATEQIRALAGAVANVPIIAVSANAFVEDRDRCIRSGMNRHVSKPIRRDELIQAIVECLAEKPAKPDVSDSEVLKPSTLS